MVGIFTSTCLFSFILNKNDKINVDPSCVWNFWIQSASILERYREDIRHGKDIQQLALLAIVTSVMDISPVQITSSSEPDSSICLYTPRSFRIQLLPVITIHLWQMGV
jgi:hypothetical protein